MSRDGRYLTTQSNAVIALFLAVALAGCATLGHRESSATKTLREQDWSRVQSLSTGTVITVTASGGEPVMREFVAATDSELVSLNLTNSTIPRQVKNELRRFALNADAVWALLRRDSTFISGRVQLAPGGVFVEGRPILRLEEVFDRAHRSTVATISRQHSAARRGFALGALVGLGVGLANTFASCGTNWSQESESCGNLTPALLFIAPIYGTLLGGLAGAVTTTSTVVYRAPGPTR